MTHEARIEETPTGLQPADGGWFILNLADIGWYDGGDKVGLFNALESPHARSDRLGIGVNVMQPGQSAGYYHAEDDVEGFLVLSGECLAIVEGCERPMRAWDYLCSPPGTAHMLVGAGDGPCAVLMVGSRGGPGGTHYIQDEAAARHGVSPPYETSSADEVYADRPPFMPARSPWPLGGA